MGATSRGGEMIMDRTELVHTSRKCPAVHLVSLHMLFDLGSSLYVNIYIECYTQFAIRPRFEIVIIRRLKLRASHVRHNYVRNVVKNKNKTEMIASVQRNKSKHTRG